MMAPLPSPSLKSLNFGAECCYGGCCSIAVRIGLCPGTRFLDYRGEDRGRLCAMGLFVAGYGAGGIYMGSMVVGGTNC